MDDKLGWLIYNKGFKNEHSLRQYKLYEDACENRGVQLVLKTNFEINVLLTNTAVSDINEIDKPDFVIFLDKDIFLAKQLELLGFKIFNSASCIEQCDNKNLSQMLFTKNNIKTPKTIISKLDFSKNFEVDFNFNNFVVNSLGFPLIVKEALGSFGQQVHLINTISELEEIQKKLWKKEHLYQEFIKTSVGKDVRVYVVNNRVISSILRSNRDDFRANITTGGSAELFNINKDFERVVLDAVKAVNADFAGVDILFGENNEPIVCEVNSNAYFLGLFDLTGVNIADYIIKFILEEFNENIRM